MYKKCNSRGILSLVAIETTIISLSIGVISVEYQLFGFLWFGLNLTVGLPFQFFLSF